MQEVKPRTDVDYTPGADDPSEWPISRRTGKPRDRISTPPDTPPRGLPNSGPLVEHATDSPSAQQQGAHRHKAELHRPRAEELETVNTALHLRCPLLVTGKPGTGKSTLPHAIAHELGLSRVLRWPVTSRTVPGDGLYHYDTIARLQNSQIASRTRGAPAGGLDSRIRLGQPGTATPPTAKPPVQLDEFDKNDIDLPNDLLNIPKEDESTTNPPRRAAVARRAPPHPPHSTMNDLPLPRFLGRTGSGRPTRKSALPGELPMPDQNPTPATHTPNTTDDTHDTQGRIVSFRWPSKPTLSTGACFTYAFSLGGLLATGRISDPTRAWQLVVLAVTSMTCGAILALTQRTRRNSTDG
ncbi:hypothetical protein FNV65_06695 [Streptomyces sp. S1A1-8]|uniref:hypothetical protein n=1 Tax=unclassified Streptomyces TaxID=2593676 RepID=UPI0011641893|nr:MULTISPECIES: hypothetical protein [unclassified Streptomyces]QDN96021.1 hypothetical protein FNV58_08120 [Streptomyces sp. RLB1-9]QDO17742.1 hypothetical protein FNV65_06695 [Streptomyces sp. S1A1-8]QDO27870.1 hypothetical protein FNV63_06705 [Streptomyces sp. S1A1-3]